MNSKRKSNKAESGWQSSQPWSPVLSGLLEIPSTPRSTEPPSGPNTSSAGSAGWFIPWLKNDLDSKHSWPHALARLAKIHAHS